MVKLIKKKRNILALDLSSKSCGIAYKGSKFTFYCAQAKEKDYSRLINIGKQFKEFIKYQVPEEDKKKGIEVWVETPFYSPGGSNDLPIKMIHGIFLYIFAEEVDNYCWNYVHVSTWRKDLGGFKGLKGKELKATAIEIAREKYKLRNLSNDDVADALCILSWAKRYAV